MKASLVTIIILGALPGVDDPKAQAIKEELSKLQATWEEVSVDRDGKQLPLNRFGKELVIIEGDHYKITVSGEVRQSGTIVLDPTTNPKSIDYVVTGGMYAGTRKLGIYEWDGDNFRECHGKERPKDFASQPGHFVGVYKPMKP
jgi:uncharacterized protein (TIGR03067 family)